MQLYNLPISRKIALAFGLVLCATMMTSAVLFLSLRSLASAESATRDARLVIADLDRAVNSVSDQAEDVRDYLMTLSNDPIKAYHAAAQGFTESLADARRRVAGQVDGAAIIAVIDKVDATGKEWHQTVPDHQLKLADDPASFQRAFEVPVSPPALMRMSDFRKAVAAARSRNRRLVRRDERLRRQATRPGANGADVRQPGGGSDRRSRRLGLVVGDRAPGSADDRRHEEARRRRQFGGRARRCAAR